MTGVFLAIHRASRRLVDSLLAAENQGRQFDSWQSTENPEKTEDSWLSTQYPAKTGRF